MMAKNSCSLSGFGSVINPMGFDSFGLPAENAARERGLNPAIWTKENITAMKGQLDDLAIQFDWREATSNPSFYKWTQELFLKLFDAGLVYKSYAQVNWDPVDNTVLADEQVDEEGRSWRSGAIVERRYFRQWFVKVNAFTHDIWRADDVDPETWRDILLIQRGWIGKPCGWIFYLPIRGVSGTTDVLPVFTTRPELFFSRDSELVIPRNHWLKQIYDVTDSSRFHNPFTESYMKIVITDNEHNLPPGTRATIQTPFDNQPVTHTTSSSILRKQALMLARMKRLGGYYTSEKYRDWLVSRQRFWGTPIPAIHCKSCEFQPVPREDLPVLLPTLQTINDDSRSKLVGDVNNDRVISPIEKYATNEWRSTKCPSCGGEAVRECETFDTLFDSSWYFLRYSSEPLHDKPFDKEKAQPVWCYIGGKEHASMHLFYARFVTHFLNSIGELSFKEPFTSLLVQGVVKSKTYKLNGKYLSRQEADQLGPEDKKKLVIEYEKMSKSKGNGVDPQDLIDTYGADATRFCLMSYANPRSERLWRSNSEEFKDVLVYLRRVFLTVHEYCELGSTVNGAKRPKINDLSREDLANSQLFLSEQRNRASADAIFSIQDIYQFRQHISVLHVLTTALRNSIRNSSVYTREYAECLGTLIIMLNPIMPHLTEELWLRFSGAAINPLKFDGGGTFNLSLGVSDQPWPLPDQNFWRSRCFNKCVSTI